MFLYTDRCHDLVMVSLAIGSTSRNHLDNMFNQRSSTSSRQLRRDRFFAMGTANSSGAAPYVAHQGWNRTESRPKCGMALFSLSQYHQKKLDLGQVQRMRQLVSPTKLLQPDQPPTMVHTIYCTMLHQCNNHN